MSTLNKWELNNRILESKLFEGDPLGDLFKKNAQRPGFEYTNDTVFIPAVFQRFVGIDGDEDAYYNKLFDLNERLMKNKSGYVLIDQGFDKRLDNNLVGKLQNLWQGMEQNLKASSEYIADSIVKPFLSEYTDTRQKDLALSKIKKVLDTYIALFGLGKLYELKNIVFHIIHWHNVYLPELFKNYDYIDVNPKVLFYGKISKREVYFLLLLHYMGVDICYFHPGEDCFLSELDKDKTLSGITEYPRRLQAKPFPTERTDIAVQTEAKIASEELRETLHADDSYLYRPWQFIDYQLDSKIMHSTYEEIAIFSKEDAKMRTGWHAGQGVVTLSNFFSLIKGVHSDQQRYWKELHGLVSQEMTILIDSLPVMHARDELKKKEYYDSLSSAHILDMDKLLSAPFWPYKRYPNHVQKQIASKMILLCQLKGIKRDKSMPVEIQKIKIFTLLLQIPEKFLQILQQFDFPGKIPKIVVYNSELNGYMTHDDALFFLFMASSGIDVFIFTPSAHNDVEEYIDEECYDKHYLEKIEFNLQYKSRSIFGRFF